MTSPQRRMLAAIVGFVAFLVALVSLVVFSFVTGSQAMASRYAPKLSTRP